MPYVITVNPDENAIYLHRDQTMSHVMCEVYPQAEHGEIENDIEAMRLATLFANAEETAKERDGLAASIRQIRDSVLHCRGPLAEEGLTSEQVNAVLAVIDDEMGWIDFGE